jgi:outer membrane protein OmpA-like peptidoglycan-associated protein/outer membrane protein W
MQTRVLFATPNTNKGVLPMLFRNRLLIHVALVAAVASPTIATAVEGDWLDEGDWLLRVGVHQLNPDKSNLPGVLGGDLVFDKAEALSLDAEYMFGDHFGVDLFVPTYFSLDLQQRAGTVDGAASIGETDLWTPILGLNWHFNPDGAVRPYIGVGAYWADFSGEEVFGPTGLPANSRLEIDQAFGPAGRIGVDIGTSEHWFLNLDVRYLELDTDVDATVPAGIGTSTTNLGEATIDPWLYGVAIGYRFGAPKPLPVPVEEEPPPPPPPPPPPEKCPDGDADGVCDADDKCPNTASGTRVDQVGCPLSQTLKLLFDFDSAELRPESINELERLVKFMNEVPFATALIEGHTDSVGADAYNLALSDRRAKSVFDYLTSRGVDPARLKSVGKGESEPVADNATDAGRQENRRVMLIRTDTGT